MTNPFEIPKERRESEAYAVPKLRVVVKKWRAEDYPQITKTSKELLKHWFFKEHSVNGGPFSYYFCQREAVETIIYCYEVLKIKKFYDIAKFIGKRIVFDPSIDKFPRFVFKMATGSGKTKVISLIMVWSYFNSILENIGLSKNFLLIAPNVIVYERLKSDFEEGKIFHNDPLIPNSMKRLFDMKVILREEEFDETSEGVLFLTNIQRLYENKKKQTVKNPILNLIGNKPLEESNSEKMFKKLLKCDNIMVFNDEAHHIHLPSLKWSKTILRLYNEVKLCAQMDFTATPKDHNGVLFPWIITDYPISDAILTRVVKKPIIGKLVNGKEVSSNKASIKYSAWIDASVKRWEEYWKKLYENIPREEERKKPILFVMANNTTDADDIANYLEGKQLLKGKILTIHTGKSGEIIKKDLEKAREASKLIDTNKTYRAIVSVLMLREGWDVKNVTVILGLRPYTSKAEILPEQTIGRGLRLMYGPYSNITEEVDVIGNEAFEKIVRELNETEGVEFGEFILGKGELKFEMIYVDEKRTKHDLEFPILSPILIKTSVNFNELKVDKFFSPKLVLKSHLKSRKIKYEGKDPLTKKVVLKRTWTLPIPQNAEAVIGFFTQRILITLGIPGRFNELVPYVKKYLENFLFKTKVDLNKNSVLMKLDEAGLRNMIINVFKDEILKLTIKPKKVTLEEIKKISETIAFPWKKNIYNNPKKCIFNKVPCDNKLEEDFVYFLEDAKDVISYSKLEKYKTGLAIEYLNKEGNISNYFPDFIVNTKNKQYLVETKGREDIDVAFKDARAKSWCDEATKYLKKGWKYIKVTEGIFRTVHVQTFKELVESQEMLNYSKTY